MAELTDFIKLSRLPTGRLIHCLRETHERSEQMRLDDVTAACERAIEHAVATQKLEREYAKRKRKGRATPEALKLDPILDSQVRMFRDVLQIHLKSLHEGEPLHERTSKMLAHLFPRGVAAITNLPYVEQHIACEDLVREAAEFRDVLEALSLKRPLEAIAETTARYGDALHKNSVSPDFAAVRAHRAKGLVLLAEVIAIAVGRFHGPSAGELSARRFLLGGVLEQYEAHRRLVDRGKGSDHVDPDTGAPSEEEEPQPA